MGDEGGVCVLVCFYGFLPLLSLSLCFLFLLPVTCRFGNTNYLGNMSLMDTVEVFCVISCNHVRRPNQSCFIMHTHMYVYAVYV